MENEVQTPEQQAQEWEAVRLEREDPAAAAAAAAETPTETPSPETPPAGEEQGQAAQQPQVADDPYEGLSPAVRAKLERMEQLEQQNQQLAAHLRETAGRVSSLQSNWDRMRQAQPAAGVQPTQAQVQAAAQNPQAWEQLKADFPEWGAGIEAFVNARLQNVSPGMTPEQVQQLVEQRTAEARAAAEQQMQHLLVDVKHPDWRNTLTTTEFRQWFATQPAEVRVLADSPRGQDAVRVLDLYAASKTPAARDERQGRQKRLEAAVSTVNNTPPPSTPVKSFDDMTPAEQWAYLAAERERQRR